MGAVASQRGAHRVVLPVATCGRWNEMSAVHGRFAGPDVIEPACDDLRPQVLVFEDDQSLCDLYGELIAEVGFRVSTSSRVFDSCEPVAALAPALILLDLFFRGDPVGLRFLALLKTDPRTAASRSSS
jgi:hypothetical protein